MERILFAVLNVFVFYVFKLSSSIHSNRDQYKDVLILSLLASSYLISGLFLSGQVWIEHRVMFDGLCGRLSLVYTRQMFN